LTVTFALILALGQLAANAAEQKRSLAVDGLEQINATTVAVAQPCARAWLRRQTEGHGGSCFVPNFHDGRARGFKVFCVRPGSIPYELGFRNGDILESILGFEFPTPESALKMWDKLMQLPPQ
jgi:hypothetical protein